MVLYNLIPLVHQFDPIPYLRLQCQLAGEEVLPHALCTSSLLKLSTSPVSGLNLCSLAYRACYDTVFAMVLNYIGTFRVKFQFPFSFLNGTYVAIELQFLALRAVLTELGAYLSEIKLRPVASMFQANGPLVRALVQIKKDPDSWLPLSSGGRSEGRKGLNLHLLPPPSKVF